MDLERKIDLAGIKTAYIAAPEHIRECLAEINKPLGNLDNLVLSGGAPVSPVWCHNIWLNPEVIKISSISDGVKKLKERGRNWILFPHKEVRRGKLIEEGLPYVSKKALKFPTPPPSGKLGSFTLIDKETILASSDCSSAFPNGEAVFEEFKVGPPSRAYLKLWESFTLLGEMPKSGEKCFDAGACPGGWSWVLQKLGSEVLAVDRSPLDPSVGSLPGIQFEKGDALAMGPEEVGEFDWVFSDVICFPERLLGWVERWIKSGATRHILVTIKFKGEDYKDIQSFKKLGPQFLRHLSVNKNEVTFFWKK